MPPVRRNGDEEQVCFWIETISLQKCPKSFRTLVVPIFTPLNSWIIHLVDDNDQLIDPLHLCENSMFTSLTTLIKPGFILPLARTDNKNPNICLCSPGDHVRNITLVTRCIQDGVPTLRCLKHRTTHFHCQTFFPFLFGGVECPR